MKPIGLSFLAGAIGALGFAPLSLWPLTLAAFAVLLWLIETAPRLRSALARGWWFGVGQFTVGLNWIATAFTYQAAMPAWLGWVAVALLSLYLAIFPAMAAGLAWRWARHDRVALILVFAAAWIVTEWLRAGLFTGFAWNPVGVTLLPTGLAGTAQWIGTYGLSGLTVLVAGALFLLARSGTRVAAGAVLLAAGAGGTLAWAAAPRAPARDVALRVVQPNINQQDKWDPAFAEESFRRHARLSGGARPDRPRLLLWPEAATPEFLSVEPRARQRIARLLGPNDLLLLGGVELTFGPDGRPNAAYNSLYALDPAGRLRGRYDKAHLVPYGEYLPMRPILSALGISRLAPGDLDFLSGPGARTIDLPGFGRAGVQICYEIIFSGQVVDPADRPDFIFNPSNDAWFGAWGPPQHLAQARLRAIEEGLPVIRATPTGISAVIDANGVLLGQLRPGVAGMIDSLLPGAAPPTLFVRFGNVLPLIFALLLVAGAIAVGRKRR
ncbi:apolipoprotein N-acyltransferase [Sphingosinicella sp.]|uniref:apolipoprotein N-acyltransferase n=1 Tax=Sphingosinicella sp. TaxID=1917971 RepID=UPI004037BE2E